MKNLFIIMILIFTALNAFSQEGYGELKIFNNGELYYEKGIDKKLVDKLGQYLIDSYFFDGTPRSIQLLDEGINYVVKIIVSDSLLADKYYIKQVKYYTSQLSENVFNFKPVDIHLSNPYFITKKVVKHFRLGNKLKFGKDDVYYLPDFNEQRALKFAEFLKEVGFLTNDGKAIQIKTLNDILIFSFPVESGYENNQEYINVVYEFAEQISQEFYNGGKVIIYLTDSFFDELRAVSNF